MSDEIEEEKHRLTVQAKTSFGTPPPPFASWFVENGRLHMPRFYGLQRFGRAETDERVEGSSIDITFQGSLTDVQTRASNAVAQKRFGEHDHQGAIVVLPCGMGKTVFAVHLTALVKRKTCVLVHKSVIRAQWKEAIERFCPGTRGGFLQGKRWDVGDDYDVVIGMVMTVAKRDFSVQDMDSFGMVIVDEAHHIAAPVMNLAMRKFRARYICGLTATKERPDGLTPLLHWSMGPEGFQAERGNVEPVRVTIVPYTGGTRDIRNKQGTQMQALMLNQLAQYVPRNQFIASRIVAMRRRGRVIMVLSDRLVQLDVLKTLVVSYGIPEDDVGIFKGGSGMPIGAEQLKRPIVMCSYGMATEGVDKDADTCVMAHPKEGSSNAWTHSATVCYQTITLVVDIADDVFDHLKWKRKRTYDKERYQVQFVSKDAERTNGSIDGGERHSEPLGNGLFESAHGVQCTPHACTSRRFDHKRCFGYGGNDIV